MAKLNKNEYNRRNENAARRMEANSKIKTLNKDQHNALANLCKARHELHSNIENVIKSDLLDYKQNIVYANVLINESGIESMNFVGTDTSDYIDIDSVEEAKEFDEVDIDDEDYQEWYDYTYNRIYQELENFNKNIEDYLKKIDEKYLTNYAPTGAQRIF